MIFLIISLEEISDINPEKIVISPGPSNPDNAGISVDVAKFFGEKIPILGVCLGHQCIAQAFGGIISNAGEIRHGKTSFIHHDGKGVYKGIKNPFEAVRYHSLSVQKNQIPDISDTPWCIPDTPCYLAHCLDNMV